MAQKFNPIKEETDGVRARRVIWSTEAIDMAIKGLSQGKRLVANPFYDGNTRLLKGDLAFERTDEEIKEWIKCKEDILYFCEKYCKIKTPKGITHFNLRDYQKNYLKHLSDNQLSICLQCRQSGKTSTTSLFMLHFMLFNVDKNALICSNKFKSAKEVVTKAKAIYQEIPYFLKPGIYKWNEAEIVMDNGCRIMAETTTIKSGVGDTIDFLLLDEFAHVPPHILDTFYNNVFPTISAAKAKLAIISTQNGRNLFYRLYMGACQGLNEYKPFKVEWQDVPEWNPETGEWEKRGQEWYERQVGNYGSVEAFESQMGTKFDLDSNTLVSTRFISKISAEEFQPQPLEGVTLHEYWFWKPGYDINRLSREFLVITCDLAEGLSQDYTVFSVYRLTTPGSDDMECIGYFRCNTRPRHDCSVSLLEFITLKTNQLHTILSYERNTYGELFKRDLLDTAEERFPSWSQEMIVKFYNEAGTKYNHGVLLTRANKSANCVLFKEDFESSKIINTDERFLFELQNFCDDGKGYYKASYGHDDIVMTVVQLEFVKPTLQFANLREEFDMIYPVLSQDKDEGSIYEMGTIYDFMNVVPGQMMSLDQTTELINMNTYYNGW